MNILPSYLPLSCFKSIPNPTMNVNLLTLFKQTLQEFARNNMTRLDAALAYYVFASFFPLLLIFVASVGLALNYQLGMAEDARRYVIETVSSELPPAMQLLQHNMDDMEHNRGILGVVALLTGIWAASNIFVLLENAFNVIFDTVPAEMNWKTNLKSRLRAILIVLLLALLMGGSLIFGTLLSMVESFGHYLPGGHFLAWLLNLAISLSLTMFVFAALFKYIPNKFVTWKAALIGGMFSSLAWQLGRELLTWWLGSRTDMTVSAVVGSVFGVLALIYYGSQILMVGAQLTATYDKLAHRGVELADDGSIEFEV